jgi:hypothetical protein
MQTPKQAPRLSRIELAILVLGLTTAFIHLVLLNILIGQINIVFLLSGLGYLILVASYLTPQLLHKRLYIRWLLIIYTSLSIIGWWLLDSAGGPLGVLTKLVEIALIVLLLVDGKKKSTR